MVYIIVYLIISALIVSACVYVASLAIEDEDSDMEKYDGSGGYHGSNNLNQSLLLNNDDKKKREQAIKERIQKSLAESQARRS